MTDTFASHAELLARIDTSVYPVPNDTTKLRRDASELIDFVSQGRAQVAFDSDDATLKALLSDATCDQVEYWLEVGPEHDVVGLVGSLTSGRWSVSKVTPALGPRALRTLKRAGLFWSGVGAI